MKKWKIEILKWSFATLLLFSVACKADVPEIKATLVSAKEMQLHSADEIRKNAEFAYGAAALSVRMQYPVSVRKMIYHTKYKGKFIKASGLVFIPMDIKKPANLLSIQHGTIFNQKEAPGRAIQTYSKYEMLASSGFVIFIPDYIGYGESLESFHPYFDYNHSAEVVMNMIKAGEELLFKENISHTGRVFLAGYSEGGYVTLAAHKKLEENPLKGIKVAASAAGAGGYDLQGVLSKALLEKKEYPAPAYLAFVLMAYNHIYNWERPLTDFFEEKSALQLQDYRNGSNYGARVNSLLPTNLEALFAPAFYASLKGKGEEEVKAKLAENSVHDWKPKAPVRLYHGTADEIVPYSTSQTTLDNFKKREANAALISIEGGTHGSSFMPMLLSLIVWFDSMQ